MSGLACTNKLKTLYKSDFNVTLDKFLKGAQAIMDSGNPPPYKLVIESGRKYAKIVRTENGGGRSAWGFIDLTNGDVLKAAGWATPAKHPRGNIFDSNNGLKFVDRYGPSSLR